MKKKSKSRKKNKRRRTKGKVSSKKYNFIFSPKSKIKPIRVDPRVWDSIAASLPPSYQIPDPFFTQFAKKLK